MDTHLKQFSQGLADLVAGAAESLLRVEARRRLPASGIAWTDKLIVTANHVVETDEDIHIGTAAGERVPAQLLGRDPRRDLALLAVDGGLTPAAWAEADSLRVGALALALARPRQGIRAAHGIVAGLPNGAESGPRRHARRAALKGKGPQRGPGRKRRPWQKRIMRGGGGGLIRVDLTMYPGFSGGALLGVDGKVHGMTTSGFGGGFSLAIPVAALSRSVAALEEHGEIRSGYLGTGLQMAQLPAAAAETLKRAAGLLIVSVEADSPAAAAGMLVGDIVTALDGQALQDIDGLQNLLQQLEIGATVSIEFVRGGALQAGKITIGAR